MFTINIAERVGVGFAAVGIFVMGICIYKMRVDHHERMRIHAEYLQRTVMLNDEVWIA